MNFINILTKLDRKIIYLILAIVIIVPIIFKLILPVGVTKDVKSVFDYIENLSPGDGVILSFSYDPASMAELSPMARAVVEHCFKKDLKVLGIAFWPTGSQLALNILNDAAKENNKEYGKDYVFAGYKPIMTSVMIGMAKSIEDTLKVDYKEEDIRNFELFHSFHNYDQTKLIIDFAAGDSVSLWIVYAQTPYKVPFAAGVTAVMAADYYPFLQSGQLLGLINGLKGASEYESLVNKPGEAMKGMTPQTLAHLLIILLIIMGNIGYFLTLKERGGNK